MVPPLTENEPYQELLKKLDGIHQELKNGLRENPAMLGEKLEQLRLEAGYIRPFVNAQFDILNDEMQTLAAKKKKLYDALRKSGKSENASKNHLSEWYRVEDVQIVVLQNHIKMMLGDYERFDAICMMMQSRLKEFTTERLMK